MDIIARMFDDTLWIYTAIAGALLGAAFLAYFKDTRLGIWSYAQFDRTLDYLVNRWGITWLKQDEESWRKKYPSVAKKIDSLEKRLEDLEK